jgi:cytochrome P450
MNTVSSPPALFAADVDLSDPNFFEDPYRYYAHLRRTQPAAPIRAMNAWLLTRHADVRRAWMDDALKIDFERLQTNRMGPGVVRETFFEFGRNFLAFADPPEHTAMKALFVQGFTRLRAQSYLPTMRRIVEEVVEETIDKGNGDIIHDFTRNVPLRIISTLLGVPRSDQEELSGWVDDYHPVIGFPPMTEAQTATANAASVGMADYFRRAVAEREKRPGADLISELIAANAQLATPLDNYAIIANLFLLYHAGQETQKYQVGTALVQLQRHPQNLAYLREDPTRAWNCLDEIMRFDSVSQIVARVAVEDVEYSGQAIARGQTVLLSIGAANRDPDVFDAPDEFNFDRPNARAHVSFGGGAHTCIGNGIARLSVPLMLEIFLGRLPRLRIEEDRLVRMRTLSKRGFVSVPARWD